MAQFNPAYERKQEETYLNYSRGAMSPDVLQKAPATQYANNTANFGQIFLTGVEAKDKINMDRIRTDMTETVDAVRDAYIGTSNTSEATSGEVPANLVKQIDRMTKVNDAHKANKMSEKHYWMQMENIARATRSKFPGYREYIDNVMGDLVGITPANALAKAVMDDTNAESANQRYRRSLEKDLAETGQYHTLSPETIDGMTDDQILRVISNYKGQEISSIRNAREIDAEMKAGTLTDRIISARASTDVYGAMSVDPELVAAQHSFNQMRATLNDEAAAGRINDEVHGRILATATSIANRRIALTNEILNRPDYAQRLPSDERQKLLDNVVKEGQTLTAGVGRKDYTIADTFNIRNQAIAESDRNLMLSLDNTGQIRMESALAATSPEMYKDYLARNFEKRLLNNRDQLLSDAFRLRVQDSTQPQYTLNDHAKNINDQVKSGAMSESAATQTLDNDVNSQIRSITNAKYPMEWRVASAKALFSANNADFLANLNVEDNKDKKIDKKTARQNMFRKLTGPEVAASMEQIKGVDAELYNSYQQWKDYNFNALYRTELNDMQGIVVDRRNVDLSIDSTGRIVLTKNGQGSTWDNLASWWNASSNSVDRLNMTIDSMRPGWKVEGKDPLQEVTRLFTVSGVNLAAPKSPTLASTLYGVFADSFTKEWKALTENVEGLQGGKESLKRDIGTRPSRTEDARTPIDVDEVVGAGSGGIIGIGKRILDNIGSGSQSRLGGPGSGPTPRDFSDGGFTQMTPVEGIRAELEETLAVIQESPDPEIQEAARARYKGLQADLKEAVAQQRKSLDDLEKSLNEINF